MSIDSELNGEPVLVASVHFPLSGSWSAELQVAADDAPAAGSTVTFSLAETNFTARVKRSGVEASRGRIRLTGGSVDWSAVQEVRHYRNTTADQVLADVGVQPAVPTGSELAFWTRNPGTTGSTVEAIAKHLGFNWRVLPDGTVRIQAEVSAQITGTDAVETDRDPSRGLVTVAVEDSLIQPGVTFNNDSVGDVTYDLGETLRCRYYTEGRATIRKGLESIIRWVMRDTIFLGQYTASVEAQNADGTLDLLPDDERIRAQGLQSVPIRHGLPGVEVDVPTGERVLLAFDGGDPTKPFASLWHEGQVTAVRIGGTIAVALSTKVETRLNQMQVAIDTHMHPTAGTGPPSPPTPPIVWPTDDMKSDKLFTE